MRRGFTEIGAAYVSETSFASDMVLELSYLEWKNRFTESENYKAIQLAMSADTLKSKKFPKDSSLPILASECPGWVCYAEKVVGKTVFPNMSTIKTPQ